MPVAQLTPRGRRQRRGSQRLPEINVTVTRTAEPLDRVPYAVGVLGRAGSPARAADHRPRRGAEQPSRRRRRQPLQLLARPAHLDPRLRQPLQLRRARAQDPARRRAADAARRPEPAHQRRVRRPSAGPRCCAGASSSLYGNASGGVVSLQSEPAAQARSRTRVRVEGGTGKRGDDDFYKWQSWTSGRAGNASGTLSISQFKTDGYRQHSAAEIRQLNAGVDYTFSGTTIGTLRFSAADDPTAENPGALTLAEYLANPDSAAANNILRRRRQGCAAAAALARPQARGRRAATNTASPSSGCCGISRTRSPRRRRAAPGPPIGTYVGIDRVVGGARVSGSRTPRHRRPVTPAHRRRRPAAHARQPAEPPRRRRRARATAC